MRLSIEQLTVLKETVKSIFLYAKIYLFGSRVIDFVIRKIFRTLDECEFENQETFIDVVNNAYKKGTLHYIKTRCSSNANQ